MFSYLAIKHVIKCFTVGAFVYMTLIYTASLTSKNNKMLFTHMIGICVINSCLFQEFMYRKKTVNSDSVRSQVKLNSSKLMFCHEKLSVMPRALASHHPYFLSLLMFYGDRRKLAHVF